MNTLNGYSKSTLTDNYILTAAGGHIPLGNASGNVPLSNGTVNTNLRSEYSQFLLGVTIDIEVAGDKETYYPVSIKFCARKELPNIITIWKDLGSKTAVYEGNHSNGTSSMLYRYECRNNGWDGNQTYFKTLVASYGYARLVAHTEISSKDYGLLIIWLRGGGTTYKISADYPLKYNVTDHTKSDIRICYETTNIGSSSFPVDVSPKTTIENAGIYSLGYFGYGNFSGHATTADAATNATYATNIPVTQNTNTDAEWPIVWSNLNNTNSATANLLYKSYTLLTYNPSKQRISVNNLWSHNGTLTLSGTSGVCIKCNNNDANSVILGNGYFKPFEAASGKLTLGNTAARWSTIYGINGDYTGSLNVTKELTACNKHFNIGLAFNEFPAFSLTGVIVIKMPNGWTNSMNSYEIDLYEYNTNGHSKIYISGYNYSYEKRWYTTSYHVVGNYNYPVRLGYYEITNSDNSKSPRMCIILGDITSKWDYTQVHLTGVYTGRDAYNAWSSGYTIEMVSDKTVFDDTYKGLNTLTRSGWNLGTTKVEGNITATKFIKTDGTSSQFLKADGSIDNNTYVTTTQLGNYLPLAGGTMTGPITFTSGSSVGAFAKTAISFISANNVEQARIGTDNSNSLGIYSKSTIYIRPNHTFDSSTSYGLVLNHSNITYNGNKMWHAGNDGAGSGLDADLLDGLQLNDVVYRSAIAREAFTDHIFHNVQNSNNSIIVETANTYPTVTTTNNSTTIDDSNITWTLIAEGSVSQYLNVFDHNKTTYAPSNWIGLRYTVPISEYAELSLLYISHAYTGKTGYVVSVDFINASNVVTNYYKKLIEYLYTESCTIKFTNSSQTNTKIRITILKKDADLPNLAISLICGYSARGGSQGAACNYGINYHGRYVFRPYINNVWSLGTSSYKFKDIYATTLYGNLNGSYINALTGYSKASSISSIVATDTLNTALGKLEYKADYVYSWLTSVADDDEYINKWKEVVEFLDSVKEGTDILDEFVTRKTEQTITGKKTFSNEVYLRFSDATLKFYETAGSYGGLYGSETMCILTCFDQQDPKTSNYVTNYPLRTTLALQPRGGTVGIGTATPKQTLDVLGNMQISSKGSSKAPKLVIHEYYDGSNDWISEIVSDYWGQNVCSKSGFTHGLYIKLGRNWTFSNLNILDADKNPIARISKGLGHWFDGDLTVTESIHGINTYLVNTRYRRKDGTGDSMFIGDPAAVNSSYTTGGVILAYEGPLHFYTNGSKSFTALADLSVDFEKAIKIKTTTSTNYLTSGITIGGGDTSTRYITCYGKTGLSYINFGYGTGTNNCGELAFNYTSAESANNYASLSLYGGNNTLYIYPSYTRSIKEIRAPKFVGDLTGNVTGSATKLGGIDAAKYVTSDFTTDPKTIGKLPYVVSGDNVLRDSNLNYFTYLIPDGGGRNTFTLIAKLTNWKVGTNSSYALIGTIYGHRAGNAARTGVHTIVAQAVSYSTLATQKLYVDNNSQFVLQPYIVSYTKTDENGNRETANYLALKKFGSGDPIHFIGFTKDLLPLNEWIDLVCPDSNSLPTDMTIVASPELNAMVLTTSQIYDGNATRTILHSGNYTSYLPILNSSSTHATNTSKIYAPSTGGTKGLILTSNGSGAPVWSNQNTIAAGSSQVLLTDTRRPENANYLEQKGDGGVRLFKASSSMTTNKPEFDGTILHFNWDNTAGYDSQLCIANGGYNDSRTQYIQWRGLNEGTWGQWKTVAFLNDIPTSLKNPNAIKFKNTAGTVVSYDGSAAVDLTGGVNYATGATNLLLHKGLSSGVYTTVKAVKDQLKVEFGNIKECVGSFINIPHQTIANWSNESFAYNSGGIYTAIKLSGGYSGNNYGLWLLSAFGDERLYYVGLYNGEWTTLRKIAITSDIPTTLKNPHALTFATGTFSAKTYDGSSAVTVNVPTKTSHLTNDSGYLTNTSNLITITKTISVSNEWNDTGIYLDSATFTDGTGSYMVLVSISNHYFWTGVLSVILSTGVTTTSSNEILMHGGGFDTSQNSHLYLRTIGEKESGKFKILIARHSNYTLKYTFKFKKII